MTYALCPTFTLQDKFVINCMSTSKVHQIIRDNYTKFEYKLPKVGDRYTDLFESDLMFRQCDDLYPGPIIEVCEVYDDGLGCHIIAEDYVGYDCYWSSIYNIFCYSLQPSPPSSLRFNNVIHALAIDLYKSYRCENVGNELIFHNGILRFDDESILIRHNGISRDYPKQVTFQYNQYGDEDFLRTLERIL